jgi:hypothetical protein
VPAARIGSFREFWPYYLSQHRKRLTRSLHFFGTDAAAIGIVVAALQRSPRLLLTALGLAYGLAWVGHLLVEHNRPATFQYPLWSLAADWKMWALRLTGRLDAELRRHDIEPREMARLPVNAPGHRPATASSR